MKGRAAPSPIDPLASHPATGGMPGSFNGLLLSLYRGIEGPNRWSTFLQQLGDAVGGSAVTLVLRQPALGDRGELFDVNTVKPIVEVYRSRSFADDPFRDLPEGLACNIFDRVGEAELHGSQFYQALLALDGTEDILTLNIAYADHYVGSLRISRRAQAGRFGAPEKALLTQLYPHIQSALATYERARRHQIESCAYIRAMDQLAFGVVILNDRGDIVHFNETAARLIGEDASLRINGDRLRTFAPADDRALDAAIATNLAEPTTNAARTGWLKLARRPDSAPLHILLKPIFEDESQEVRPIGVALYVAINDRPLVVAFDACATLFGLSRAEVALLSELVGGASVLSASTVLGITESTARTQLRSIFAKTGTHRQADLVRLVLTSLAVIA